MKNTSNNNNLYIILLDNSDIEYDKKNKELIIHNGNTQIKYYNSLEELTEAIDNNKWIIYKVLTKAENNYFQTGEICFPIEINDTEKHGILYKVLSQSGKIGWIHSNCLKKITKNIFSIKICECLD